MFLNMLIAWPIVAVTCVQISRIDNVFLIPIATVNITTILDSTCDQCICLALDSHSAAMNYFLEKHACQLFDRVPITYQLQPYAQATLYLSSGSSPNASQCCMPDLNLLIEKLANAMITPADQPNPRCLALDNHGYLVTVQYGANVIMRYSSPDLILIDRIPLSESEAKSITFHDNAYYVGTDSKSIEVVDSNSLLTVNVITDPTMSGVRDIVFLHDGDTMVVSSINNQKILFFKRASASSVDYTLSYEISTSYPAPHGLWYVNDSFFYATSWDANSVYSYTTEDGVTWTEKLFADVSLVADGGVSHVMVDACERRWVSRADSTLFIYDSEGKLIGKFGLASVGIFDAMFLDNYVLYVTDLWGGKIMRLDPGIKC